MTFNEVSNAEFSTIASFNDADYNAKERTDVKKYDVKTILLNDLLRKYNAPKDIDFLSIDTEGSEFDILSHFDFINFNIKIIVCEHNFSDKREPIFQLLTQKGYTRKYQELSQFDDWYVKI